MAGFERRLVARSELRAEGRRLSGTVMAYGDVSTSHRERFAAGALRMAASVPLNLMHNPMEAVAWHPGGGLRLEHDDSALRMVADVPPIPAGDTALQMVREGHAKGLSVEFRCERERREAGLRIVEQAELTGIGIVRSPSYGGSHVEARRRSGRTLRASIPTDRDVSCECAGKGGSATGQPNRARILGEAMDDMWRKTFTDSTQQVAAAYLENYSMPLASNVRGTLRGRITGLGGYEVDIDIPDSAAGRSLLDAWESSGLIVRPFVADQDTSIVDGVNVVRGGRLRAVIVTATDSREGWPEPELVDTPDMPDELAGAGTRRRQRLWL